MTNLKTHQTILASRDVSTDSVLESLLKVQNTTELDTVTVQDLLVSHSHHKSLFPVAESTVHNTNDSTNTKEWRFVDSLAPRQFATWQSLRDRLLKKQVTLQANVHIPQGTSRQDTVDFFYALLADPGIVRVVFSGALYGDCPWDLPREICDLLDPTSHQLQESITLQVLASNPQDDDDDELLQDDWQGILMDCCRALESLPLPVLDVMEQILQEEEAEAYQQQQKDCRRRNRPSWLGSIMEEEQEEEPEIVQVEEEEPELPVEEQAEPQAEPEPQSPYSHKGKRTRTPAPSRWMRTIKTTNNHPFRRLPVAA